MSLCFIRIGRSSYSLKHEPPASQLGLFEAPHPWGPWAAFYVKQPWGVQGKPGGYLQCTQCLSSLSLFLSVCHMCILRGQVLPGLSRSVHERGRAQYAHDIICMLHSGRLLLPFDCRAPDARKVRRREGAEETEKPTITHGHSTGRSSALAVRSRANKSPPHAPSRAMWRHRGCWPRWPRWRSRSCPPCQRRPRLSAIPSVTLALRGCKRCELPRRPPLQIPHHSRHYHASDAVTIAVHFLASGRCRNHSGESHSPSGLLWPASFESAGISPPSGPSGPI